MGVTSRILRHLLQSEFYGLFTRQGFTGVLVNVGPVLIDAKAVEEAKGSPLGGRPGLHRPLLADKLGRGPEVDVLPIRERLERGAVLGVIGGDPELLLGEVSLDDRPALWCPHALPELVGLLLVDALGVRVAI